MGAISSKGLGAPGNTVETKLKANRREIDQGESLRS